MKSSKEFIKDRISVVIPVYGAEEYLSECIDSVLRHRSLDLEVVCVHDESPDNSLEILKEYDTRAPGTLRVIDQKNTGGATAINNGMDIATGEFIMILDNDDFILENKLQHLWERIRNDRSDFVVSRIYKYTEDEYQPVYDREWILSDYVLTNELQKLKLCRDGLYTGMLFRSDFLRRNQIRMIDGLRIADRPFTSLAYACSRKISVVSSYTCAWRKRHNPESKSLTDRLNDKQEVNDRVESAKLQHDALATRGFHQFKDQYDKDLAQRLIWSLRRGWSTGWFDAGFHRHFYAQSKSYYRKLDVELFGELPLYSKTLSMCLHRQQEYRFLLFSFLAYLASLGKDLGVNSRKFVKRTLRVLAKKVPVGLVRFGHRHLPQYRHQRSYRRFLRTTKVDQSIMVFESCSGKSYSGNPKYVYRYILTNMPETKCVWVNLGTKHKIHGDPIQVTRGTNEYYYFLARAGYWVSDMPFPVEHKRKETKYLQTWHGTPFKRLGFDLPDDVYQSDEKERFFRESTNWNFLLTQSDHSAECFKSAFAYEGDTLQFGYPCNDIFHADGKEELRSSVRQRLNIGDQEKVVLYAPTWRSIDLKSRWEFTSQIPIDYSRWVESVSENTVLLVREHHLVQPEPIGDGFGGRIIDVSRYDDVSELLLIADCLITDYSSICFDFLHVGKPIIFYMHDRDNYESTIRPFYIDSTEGLPGPTVTEQGALIELVKNSDEVLRDFLPRILEWRKTYCPNDDGEAAKRVVRHLLSGGARLFV